MAAPTFQSIANEIKTGKLAPVYILHGEEGYYTDELVKMFENFLPEADREFNQYVLYAPETQAGQVMDLCYRYPMMAERQMVILKEAQAVSANEINRLHKYVQNPSPTTVFVICFRGDKAKGKDLLAAAKTKATVFESKKVAEYSIVPIIAKYIKDRGLNAEPKALEMLRDYIGTNLSALFNEIDKVAGILGKGATITPEAVERHVGISKEYNNFELVDALAKRDYGKAMRISQYFASNPKGNPLVMTTSALYNFFSDVLVAIYTKDKTDDGLMRALNLKSSYPLRKYRDAMARYNAFQLIEIIWALRQFDTRSKGQGSRQDQYDLFHELIFHIVTAPGNLGV